MSQHAPVFLTKEGLDNSLGVFSKSNIIYQTKRLLWFSYQKDGFFEKYSNSWRRMHLELADNGMCVWTCVYGRIFIYLCLYMYGRNYVCIYIHSIQSLPITLPLTLSKKSSKKCTQMHFFYKYTWIQRHVGLQHRSRA